MAAKNPPKFSVPHHFILLPAALVMAGYTVVRYAKVAGDNDQVARLWFSLMVLALIGLGLTLLLRQHYALGLQDRLIRLEVRQRYFELTGQRFATLEPRLTLSQIIALRLAGDGELPALAQAAAAETLSPAAIKERINDFQLDTLRV